MLSSKLRITQITKPSTKSSYLYRFFTATKSHNMPLVVPGINSQGGAGDKTSEWMNKLVGKKIGDSSDQVVSG